MKQYDSRKDNILEYLQKHENIIIHMTVTLEYYNT